MLVIIVIIISNSKKENIKNYNTFHQTVDRSNANSLYVVGVLQRASKQSSVGVPHHIRLRTHRGYGV